MQNTVGGRLSRGNAIGPTALLEALALDENATMAKYKPVCPDSF